MIDESERETLEENLARHIVEAGEELERLRAALHAIAVGGYGGASYIARVALDASKAKAGEQA